MKAKTEVLEKCESLINSLPYEKRRIGTIISNTTNDEIVELLTYLKDVLQTSI